MRPDAILKGVNYCVIGYVTLAGADAGTARQFRN
jgi:hypothetical protein